MGAYHFNGESCLSDTLAKRELLIRVHCLICVFTFVFTEVLYRKDVNAFARLQAFWISTKLLKILYSILDFTRFTI